MRSYYSNQTSSAPISLKPFMYNSALSLSTRKQAQYWMQWPIVGRAGRGILQIVRHRQVISVIKSSMATVVSTTAQPTTSTLGIHNGWMHESIMTSAIGGGNEEQRKSFQFVPTCWQLGSVSQNYTQYDRNDNRVVFRSSSCDTCTTSLHQWTTANIG